MSHAYAGTDPIKPVQIGSIPSTTQFNQSYAVNFTLTSQLPFQMPTPIEITNNSTPANEVTLVDGCSGQRLTPNQSCAVGLVLYPRTAGTKKLSFYMEYGKNKIQVPNPVITTQTASGNTSQLQGTVTLGFPHAIASNTPYSLSFTFSNVGSTPLSGLTLAAQSGNTPGFTQTDTTCTTTLAASSSCSVTGTFTTAATSGTVTIGYNYGSTTVSASVSSSAVINNTAPSVSRTFTILNKCSQTIWFGFVGGSVNGNPCTSNVQCAQGSTCDPTANSGAGLCFYNDPVPTSGSYQLTTNQSTTVPVSDYNLQYVWSGNIAGRTACTGSGCETADCAGGTGACAVGHGFGQPATLAEFTLLRNDIDSYDISILNGTNVGVEITPTTDPAYPFNPNGITPTVYNCSSPGNPNATGGLGACNWTSGFTPPTAYPTANSASSYTYVKPYTTVLTACTLDSDCSGLPVGQRKCGLFYDTAVTPHTLTKHCGALLGYNTANQVCSYANTNLHPPGTPNNPGDPYFACDTAISGGTGNLSIYTNWALFACKAQAGGVLGTCYNGPLNPPASTPDCCGCVDWQDMSVAVPAATIRCVASDTAWSTSPTTPPPTGFVLSGLTWLKQACPTAYVYPFDDKASSFACKNTSASHAVNTVNYTVTFCPT
jgi:hypothetical protein